MMFGSLLLLLVLVLGGETQAASNGEMDQYDYETDISPFSQTPAVTSQPPSANTNTNTVANSVVSSNDPCDAVIAFDCRCSLQKNPPGYKILCEQLGLNAVPTNLLDSLPENTIHLSLRRNLIRQIRKTDFVRVTNLQVLDLSNNLIDSIEPYSLEPLSLLTKLNLADNRIQHLNVSVFSGLSGLARLSLSANRLPTVPRNLIRSLPALRTIDFSSATLVCDCRLKWIVDFVARVRIQGNPVCGKPHKLKDQKVHKLDFDQLNCSIGDQSAFESTNNPAVFLEMSPAGEQLSVQGDPLVLTCRAHNLLEAQLQSERLRLFWEHTDAATSTSSSSSSSLILPGVHASGITVENFMHTDSKSSSYQSARQSAEFSGPAPDNRQRLGPPITSGVMFWSELTVGSLDAAHSGDWKCVLTTPFGNYSRTVGVRVLGRDLAQCNEFVAQTSHGLLNWPRTLAGMTSSLVCPLGPAVFGAQDRLIDNLNSAIVYHRCDATGRWTQPDLAACRHVSQLTDTIAELLTYQMNVVNVHQLLVYLQRILIHARPAIAIDQLRGIAEVLDRTAKLFRDAANSSSASFSVSLFSPMQPSLRSGDRTSNLDVVVGSSDDASLADDLDAFDRFFSIIQLIASLDRAVLEEAENREGIATRLIRLLQDVAYSQVLLNRGVREFARSTASFSVVALRVPVGRAPSQSLVCRMLMQRDEFEVDARHKFAYRCDKKDADDADGEDDGVFSEPNLLTVAYFSLPLASLLDDPQIAAELDREAAIAPQQSPRKLYETSIVVEDSSINGRRSRRPSTSSSASFRNSADERSVLIQFAYFASAQMFPGLSDLSQRFVFTPRSGLVTLRIGGLQAIERNVSDRVLVRVRSFEQTGVKDDSDGLMVLTSSLQPRDSLARWSSTEKCSLDDVSEHREAVDRFTTLRCGVFGTWAAVAVRRVDRRLTFGVFVYDTVVYVAALASVTCVSMVILTYVLCRDGVHLSYKIRHAMINWNLNFVAVVAAFLFGTMRVDNFALCTGVGAVIHFLTLSVICWFSIGAYSLHKKSRKLRDHMRRVVTQARLDKTASRPDPSKQNGGMKNNTWQQQQQAASHRLGFCASVNGAKRDGTASDTYRRCTDESLLPVNATSTSNNYDQPQPALTQSFITRSRVQAARKVSTSRWKKLVRLYAFAYGIPLLIVATTLSLSVSSYLAGKCAPWNVSIWVPSGVLTALNLALFTSILSLICVSSTDLDKYLRLYKRSRRAYQRLAAINTHSCTCPSGSTVRFSGARTRSTNGTLYPAIGDQSCDSLFSDSDFSASNVTAVDSTSCDLHNENAVSAASGVLLFVYNAKQSNKEQCCVLLISYVLFAAAWCFAALCILESVELKPLVETFETESARLRGLIFAYLFAICVASFGIVAVVYFVVLRADVRVALKEFLTCKSKPKQQLKQLSANGSHSSSLRVLPSSSSGPCEEAQQPNRTEEERTLLATPVRSSQPSYVEPTYEPILRPTSVQPTVGAIDTRASAGVTAQNAPTQLVLVDSAPSMNLNMSLSPLVLAGSNDNRLIATTGIGVDLLSPVNAVRNSHTTFRQVNRQTSSASNTLSDRRSISSTSSIPRRERVERSDAKPMYSTVQRSTKRSDNNGNLIGLDAGSTRSMQRSCLKTPAETVAVAESEKRSQATSKVHFGEAAVVNGSPRSDPRQSTVQNVLPSEDDYVAVAVRKVAQQSFVESERFVRDYCSIEREKTDGSSNSSSERQTDAVELDGAEQEESRV